MNSDDMDEPVTRVKGRGRKALDAVAEFLSSHYLALIAAVKSPNDDLEKLATGILQHHPR